jgi:hypothetical protein
MHTLRNCLISYALAILSVTQIALADDSSPLKITPQPGKLTCQSSSSKIGEVTAKIELCVVAGNFSHDTYILNVDKKAVLKGIDDETTKGLTGTYQGEKITMTCVPQHEAPKEVSAATIAVYQKSMNLSAEDAKKAAIIAGTVEVGRRCSARWGSTSLIEVQVSFE